MTTNLFWNLWYDVASGDARVSEDRPGHHYDFVGRFASGEALEAKKAELAGPDVWVLFVNDPEHSAYIRKENNLTGNWRGSRDHPYRAYEEFATREEAIAAKRQYLRCDSVANDTYCYTHNPDAGKR